MKKAFQIIICSILAITLISCLSLSPAGFWVDFQEEYLVEHLNDQGPWGGKRVVHWKKDKGTFVKSEIIDFATDNGWTLKSDTAFDSNITQKWVHDGKPVFPLHWKGFIPKFDFYYTGFEDFPRWITGNILVMSFTTGFITIDLETQEGINTNGFIILNEKQNEMTLYHMWGE
jgi:hypothetical protein